MSPQIPDYKLSIKYQEDWRGGVSTYVGHTKNNINQMSKLDFKT